MRGMCCDALNRATLNWESFLPRLPFSHSVYFRIVALIINPHAFKVYLLASLITIEVAECERKT